MSMAEIQRYVDLIFKYLMHPVVGPFLVFLILVGGYMFLRGKKI